MFVAWDAAPAGSVALPYFIRTRKRVPPVPVEASDIEQEIWPRPSRGLFSSDLLRGQRVPHPTRIHRCTLRGGCAYCLHCLLHLLEWAKRTLLKPRLREWHCIHSSNRQCWQGRVSWRGRHFQKHVLRKIGNRPLRRPVHTAVK